MLGFVNILMINIGKKIKIMSLSLETAAQFFYYIGLHLWHITAEILHMWSLICVTKKNCFNHAHLIHEPQADNLARHGCVGVLKYPSMGFIIFDHCKSNPRCLVEPVAINCPCPVCAPGLDALGLDQSQASTNQIPRSSSAIPSVQVDPLELAGADQYILASQYNDTDQEFSVLEIPDTYAESLSGPVLPTRRRPRVANPRSSDDDSLPRARPRVEAEDFFVVPDGSSFVEYESE